MAIRRMIIAAVCLMTIYLSNTSLFAHESKTIVRVYFKSSEQIHKLISYDLDMADVMTKRYADIIVTRSQEQMLKENGFQIQPLIDDIASAFKRAGLLSEDMGDYHTYQEMVDEMTQTAEAFPQICRLSSIGKSIEGRDIWAIKVSDDPESDDYSEPDLLYMGNIHAREIITPEIILYFLEHLVYNYGIDSEITDFINNLELWLIPTQNPDGRVYVEQIDQWWRKNRRDNGNSTFGVDLNRNYGYMWGYDNSGSSPVTSSETYRGKGPFSEPETQAVRELCRQHDFVISLSYHSYGNWWLFPWGYTPANTEDHEIFLELALNCVAYNGYIAGNAAMGVIYETNGDTDDYFYGEQEEKGRIFGFSPEVGTTFFPPVEDIPRLVTENLGPNLYIARIAPIIANNPRRILKPAIPDFKPVPQIANGCFDLEWTINDDPDNIAIAFDIEEIEDIELIPDDLEGDILFWSLNGFMKSSNRFHSNAYSLYSNTGDNINYTASLTSPFIVPQNQEFTFWTWYDIERNWDYAYVELSIDGGRTFQSIRGNITSQYDPYGENLGNGITGSSNGWKQAIFDLSNFAGQTIMLRIRYVTDTYMANEGIYLDDINPVVTYSSKKMIAENISDMKLHVTKTDTGEFYYRIRSLDNDGQQSHWSSLLPVKIDSTNFEKSRVYLTPETVFAYPNETVLLTIKIDDTPVMIDTFSLVLSFDSTCLSYVNHKTNAFESLILDEIIPGGIFIFGTTDDPIAVGESDSLITIELIANQELSDSPIMLSQPAYDIKSMALYNGRFIAPPCLLGDVTYNGTITPEDALLAFKIYLYNPQIHNDSLNLNQCAIANADMNCITDGVTPGDALTIFRAYLNGDDPPLDCISNTANPGIDEIILTLNRGIEMPDGFIAFPIHLTARDSISSFGFRLDYSTEALTFHSLEKSNLLENWQHVKAVEINQGSLRIGGFSTSSIQDIENEILFSLSFKLKNVSSITNYGFELYDFKDDFANMNTAILTSNKNLTSSGESARTFVLEQNYPNPFNARTTIRYHVPTRSQIEISIFNSLGRLESHLVAEEQSAGIYAVEWDGRNDTGNELASGLYFYRLKCDDLSLLRKMIILK